MHRHVAENTCWKALVFVDSDSNYHSTRQSAKIVDNETQKDSWN